MKEVLDRKLLQHYLQEHQLQAVFNERIKPHVGLYSFEQGELICSQGEVPQNLYVLLKGKLKVYTTSEEGKTLILSFKTPLELIGDIEYVRGTDIVNTVEAVSPVLMLGVGHRWLHKYGKSDPQLLQFLLDHITRKFYVKSSSMSFNLMYPVEVRLASYLLSVSFDDTDTELTGRLDTTSMMDAANLLGTSYRHLNRVLRQFCAEGLIERSKGLVLVKDVEGLRKLARHNIYEMQPGSFSEKE
ncbi:Crp/Fnr family transcriptional regulator [Brevibacillus choshinensis]|uniref:Cyclic nucleotide-binding domain-containing protein n=1 Tax=Brevibacillus choshinensis TaxID=54911 RepID=A0ABX7FTI2_BRECH|nr:cyclic nucleotide-binding domain-containing protein [Brevibacillus choshinensis]QRG69482.1 cyclic nucleotide-binding domain-containing protein [Brevibacillus choshinensis]